MPKDTQADLTERAREYLDDWFGLGQWPPVHRFVELLTGFAQSEREAERAEARRAATLNRTAAEQIAAEIVSIMETHDQQEAERGYVDTPGGLEHMGDVWRLLRGWRDRLASPAPQEETR